MDRVGAGHEDGHLEAVAVRREPLEVERGLRQDDVDALALDDLEDGVREAGIGAGRHEMEGVAEMTPDRPLGHVGADEAHVALAVLAEPAQQRRGPGGARGRDEHRDRAQAHVRSILSSASCASLRSRSASSMARIVCPMVEPG